MESEILSRDVTPEVIDELCAAIGKDNVNTNGEERILYTHDLAPLPKAAGIAFDNIPDVVCRPRTTADVAAIMKIAYKSGVAVTPRAAATWGMGGCMPIAAGISLDTTAMDKIFEINTEDMYVKVQAGATWKDVLDAVMEKGFIVGSYPSSFPAATIGGWYNTNGMGTGTYKYGGVKDNMLNAEVVLPDGTIIETGYDNMADNMSGYNLNQLFAGSEGTLGVLTTVTMRLYPMGVIRPLAYEFTGELMDADPAVQALIRHPSIVPLHVAWSDSLHFANQRKAGEDIPEGLGNILLVVLQGEQKYVDFEEADLDEIMAGFGAVKKSQELAEHEWAERCYEFRSRRIGTGSIPGEVIVPAKHWKAFCEECYKAFDVMKMEAGGVIGTFVDRSTVLFMPYYFKDDESMTGMLAFAYNFYLGERAATYGGRNTGLGVFFAWNLDVYHDADTVEFMRELKTFVDPHDVMNPGHLVCGQTRFGVNLSHGLMDIGSKMMQTIKKLMPKDSTFEDNLKRWRINQLEEEKAADRKHVLGRGYE